MDVLRMKADEFLEEKLSQYKLEIASYSHNLTYAFITDSEKEKIRSAISTMDNIIIVIENLLDEVKGRNQHATATQGIDQNAATKLNVDKAIAVDNNHAVDAISYILSTKTNRI